MVERFHRRHEELYTYSLPDQEPVLVNARLAVMGELPALPEEPPLPRSGAGPASRRQVHLGRWVEAPAYDLDALAAGQGVPGPAVVRRRRPPCCCAPATAPWSRPSAGSM